VNITCLQAWVHRDLSSPLPHYQSFQHPSFPHPVNCCLLLMLNLTSCHVKPQSTTSDDSNRGMINTSSRDAIPSCDMCHTSCPQSTACLQSSRFRSDYRLRALVYIFLFFVYRSQPKQNMSRIFPFNNQYTRNQQPILKNRFNGEVLMAWGIWFQICEAVEEKARWPNLVFHSGNIQK